MNLTPEEVERIERGARKVLDDPRGVSYLAHCYAEKIVILTADWKRLLRCCETYVFALDGNRVHIEHLEAELTRQREQIERLRQPIVAACEQVAEKIRPALEADLGQQG